VRFAEGLLQKDWSPTVVGGLVCSLISNFFEDLEIEMTINYQPSNINLSTASAQAEISNLWHIKGHHKKCTLELRVLKPKCKPISKIFKGKNFLLSMPLN
jgi:hypothetical protein